LGINKIFYILLSNTLTLFSTPLARDQDSQLYNTSKITYKYLDLNGALYTEFGFAVQTSNGM
jgi:hypothetical protein